MSTASPSTVASATSTTTVSSTASSSSSTTTTPSVIINGQEVPVTAQNNDPSIDLSKVLSAKPFTEWVERIDPELDVKSIIVQSVDMFGPRVGFMKFNAHVEYHGRRMPGIVFMRGGAVAILVILVCKGEKWVVCCRQPRIPIGRSDYLEIPAGMLDDSGHFAGVAAKELREETGIDIKDTDLIDLTGIAYNIPAIRRNVTGDNTTPIVPLTPDEVAQPRGMYPSVGGCDEFIRLLYYTKEVTQEYLNEIKGKATGNIEEGEVITLDLLPYDDLWRKSTDSKTLSSILLYEKLKADGKIVE